MVNDASAPRSNLSVRNTTRMQIEVCTVNNTSHRGGWQTAWRTLQLNTSAEFADSLHFPSDNYNPQAPLGEALRKAPRPLIIRPNLGIQEVPCRREYDCIQVAVQVRRSPPRQLDPTPVSPINSMRRPIPAAEDGLADALGFHYVPVDENWDTGLQG
jgi:hypothetical protein